MGMGSKIALGVVVLAVILSGSCAMTAIGFNNNCVRQENGLEAQYQANESNYSNYFNKLKETAQVPNMYVDGLRKVYGDVMKGRYGSDGSKAVMQFIQESNPSVDSSLYVQIQRVIEAGRNSFDADQRMLLDKRRTYLDTIHQFPGSMFASLLGFPKVDLTKYDPVINDETEKAFNTHKAGPINLNGN